jgi:hypothetical protein
MARARSSVLRIEAACLPGWIPPRLGRAWEAEGAARRDGAASRRSGSSQRRFGIAGETERPDSGAMGHRPVSLTQRDPSAAKALAASAVAARQSQRRLVGGEGGIRTLGTLADTHDFQSCTFGHSVTSPGPARARHDARQVDEDRIAIGLSGESGSRTHGTLADTPDFESGTFGHSVISPRRTLAASIFPVNAGGRPSDAK